MLQFCFAGDVPVSRCKQRGGNVLLLRYPQRLQALGDNLIAVSIQDCIAVLVYLVDILKRLGVVYAPIEPLVIRCGVSNLSDADCCFIVSRSVPQPVGWYCVPSAF